MPALDVIAQYRALATRAYEILNLVFNKYLFDLCLSQTGDEAANRVVIIASARRDGNYVDYMAICDPALFDCKDEELASELEKNPPEVRCALPESTR